MIVVVCLVALAVVSAIELELNGRTAVLRVASIVFDVLVHRHRVTDRSAAGNEAEAGPRPAQPSHFDDLAA